MRGWRIKFIFLLIVYFAGFATAIYTLAPVPENKAWKTVGESNAIFSKFNSDEFAKSFNIGMHKCFDFGKEAALHTAKFIKQKIEQKHQADS